MYNSAAVVLNSSCSDRVVVLTVLPELFWVVDASDFVAEVPVGTWYLGVEKPLDGLEPAACWISLPCSAISAGASFENSWRSCGTSLVRTRSFTGAFSLDSA